MQFLIILAVLFVGFWLWYSFSPVFGAKPKGLRLNKIKALPQYRDGSLHNLSATPMSPEGVSFFKLFTDFLFHKDPLNKPLEVLQVAQPDYSPTAQTKITWYGHSSYLLQTAAFSILVDPVFSERPSPISFMGTKAFKMNKDFKIDDLPPIDVVLITHDHYDHLDYPSILKLKTKVTCFITSLGVGAHLEKWGIAPAHIIELSWGEKYSYKEDLVFTALPARHFSGRGFKRNQTLWSSFALEMNQQKIYIGADSGYDTHFKQIAQSFGSFDLAILECGQYNAYWPYIHMFPEEVWQAAADLNAKRLFPVHHSKFALAMHAWQEPLERLQNSMPHSIDLCLPQIGESFEI